jgi:hypothetical protein
MMKLRNWLIATLLTVGSAAHANDPVEFHNQYKTKMYGFSITVTNSLKKAEAGNYDLLFRFDSMLGSIVESSQIKWDASTETVVPQHYVYKRRGLGKNRDADLKFDWNAKTVLNQVQKTEWKMKLEPKVQDKLSYLLQLQHDFLEQDKSKFTYKIADGGSLKVYTFEKVGNERLKTPLGEVDTIKIKRSRSNSDRTTYAWLAPKYENLLVRLQQTEGKDSYTIDITNANVNGKSIQKF